MNILGVIMTGHPNNITGAASHRVLTASPSSISYRLPDSRCDFPDHPDWQCLDCPAPGNRCLHDFEHDSETRSVRIADHQIRQKVTVNAAN